MSHEFETHPIDSEAPIPSPRRWRYVLIGILVVVALASLHFLRQAL